jgi:hypothetical protein
MILATSFIIAVLLVILIPGLVAILRPRWAVVAIPFYVLLFVGLLVEHVGFGVGEAASIAAEKSRSPQTVCEQAIDESERAGLILDRSSASRITVNRAIWGRLPQQVKDALVECLQGMRSDEAQDVPVEVVER